MPTVTRWQRLTISCCRAEGAFRLCRSRWVRIRGIEAPRVAKSWFAMCPTIYFCERLWGKIKKTTHIRFPQDFKFVSGSLQTNRKVYTSHMRTFLSFRKKMSKLWKDTQNSDPQGSDFDWILVGFLIAIFGKTRPKTGKSRYLEIQRELGEGMVISRLG